jgi:allantoate deiminase
MALRSLADIAMLFVRCKGGISHNPAEAISAQDAGAGARVLLHFISHFEQKS